MLFGFVVPVLSRGASRTSPLGRRMLSKIIRPNSTPRITLSTSQRGAEFGNFDVPGLKVGPTSWTHCNQFVKLVMNRSTCSHPDIPCIDGRIDSDTILKDPSNFRLSEYISEGMYWEVCPSWVEDEYPWLPGVFQIAGN